MILSLLRESNYNPEYITLKDLENYFEGEAPSGDTITLEMVLQSKWLLIHEIVECSELKKLGFHIEVELLHNKPMEVFSAHLVATALELKLATQAGDKKWVRKRMSDVKSWLDDPNLSFDQRKKSHQILKEFEFYIQ